ncbi:MAG: HD domain-containing phosphohydrolase [Gemmatimonadota bacterium]
MLIQEDEIQGLVASAHDAERSGEWTDALSQYKAALLQASSNGDFPRVAELLRSVGRLHFERGDYERASESFRASLRRAEEANETSQIASSLNCLGVVEQFRGRVESAEQLYKRAGDLARDNDDQLLGAMVQQNLSTLATIRGEYDVALDHGQQALQLFREMHDDLAAAKVLNNLGMLHTDMNELGHAELSFRSSLILADRIGDAGLRVKIQINRAELALKRQDFAAAHEFCDEAFRNYTRLGSESGLAETYKVYGTLYRETTNSQLATTHFQLAIKLAQTCGDRLLEAESERERALLCLQDGEHREALSALNTAHRLFCELRARRELVDVERHLDRVEKIYLRVVQMLETEIAISFDASQVKQYQRVAQYATRLANTVGFDGRDLTWLRIGAFLYDIGKRSVPSEVLNKSGELTEEEWAIVKQHVLESEKVVTDLDPPWDMRPMVRHHHEHWDGTGYPDGLAGEDIPVAARVLCIADAFTALTSKRSFRPQMSQQQALETMEREVGRTFDPVLFKNFRALIEN